jgi:hypothetical protein
VPDPIQAMRLLSPTRLSNRLRAVLLRYYPAVLNMFNSWPTKIAMEFIRAFPTPGEAKSLSPEEFQRFARQHRYPNPKRLPACFARLQAPQPEAGQETVEVYKDEAVLLAAMLLTAICAKKEALRELKTLFHRHPDHAIFDSLPGAGDFLAPALLAKFGDDRKRFPTPASVQALAGTCPVTDQSGKRRIINRPGPMPIGNKHDLAAVIPVLPIVASPIAGWRSCGSSGR